MQSSIEIRLNLASRPRTRDTCLQRWRLAARGPTPIIQKTLFAFSSQEYCEWLKRLVNWDGLWDRVRQLTMKGWEFPGLRLPCFDPLHRRGLSMFGNGRSSIMIFIHQGIQLVCTVAGWEVLFEFRRGYSDFRVHIKVELKLWRASDRI